jgi:hypothetical protein
MTDVWLDPPPGMKAAVRRQAEAIETAFRKAIASRMQHDLEHFQVKWTRSTVDNGP